MVEPQKAIGFGFGNRFTERSEYFSELSFLTGSNYLSEAISLHGFRFIGQYRYHFFQKGQPLMAMAFRRRSFIPNHERFVGVEFRLKNYSFSNENIFVNKNTLDTLRNFLYKANATLIGGAFIFGSEHDIGTNGRWKFEITAGLGVKQKTVKFKNLPANYSVVVFNNREWQFIPKIYETTSSIYIPFTVRLRFAID